MSQPVSARPAANQPNSQWRESPAALACLVGVCLLPAIEVGVDAIRMWAYGRVPLHRNLFSYGGIGCIVLCAILSFRVTNRPVDRVLAFATALCLGFLAVLFVAICDIFFLNGINPTQW